MMVGVIPVLGVKTFWICLNWITQTVEYAEKPWIQPWAIYVASSVNEEREVRKIANENQDMDNTSMCSFPPSSDLPS